MSIISDTGARTRDTIAPRERGITRAWALVRHDRGLMALLILFVLVAPLVTRRIYASDEIQYFSYTHSLFFDQDLDFSNQYLHFYNSDKVKFADIYTDLYNKREPATNLPINVAPIGTGLLWLPGFALAHVFVLISRALGSQVAADGYSAPYIFAVCMSSYLFGCLGMLLCYSLARKRFDQWVSALSVIAVWLASSLFFYTVIAPPWSHATSLLVVTLFIWYWDRTRRPEGRSLRQWALLGASGGLVMLIREQDALFLSIPALEALVAVIASFRMNTARRVTTEGESGQRVLGTPQARAARTPHPYSAMRNWLVGLVVMGVVAAIVFIPQLITYRVITGHFGPSKVVSSKLTWTSPNALNVLFDSAHGMITWTPFLALGLLGLVFLWQRDRLLTGALLVAFLLQVYVAGSFLTWQSASSFGQRRFINCTAVFVLGFAALAAWLLAHGWPRWTTAAIAGVFILWNAGLLMQYALWCSPQRQGLDWATVIKGQFEMPGRAGQLVWDFLFNRERFYRSTRSC